MLSLLMRCDASGHTGSRQQKTEPNFLFFSYAGTYFIVDNTGVIWVNFPDMVFENGCLSQITLYGTRKQLPMEH